MDYVGQGQGQRDKVSLYKPKLQANEPTYASINPYPELTSFVFPELR